MIVFAFAMIWVGVLLGSCVATPEGVQGVAFVAIFPITFIASTFVPVDTLPGVLRTFAEWNPVTSTLADALRHLFGNPGGTRPRTGAVVAAAPDRLHADLGRRRSSLVCAPLADPRSTSARSRASAPPGWCTSSDPRVLQT